MASVIRTDRSRIESYQKCPRSRWLQYEMKAPDALIGGYQPDKPAFALEIGSGFHKGMEFLLRSLLNTKFFTEHIPDVVRALRDYHLDEAVAAGVAEYESNILPYFESYQQLKDTINNAFEEDVADDLVEHDEPFNNYTVNEGRALTEALIRVYCAAPAGLASLLEEYEVLEIEQEIDAPLDQCMTCAGTCYTPELPHRVIAVEGIQGALAQKICPTCNGSGGSIILMSRPDGILRSRKDGQLYVLSFKSTGKWDSRKANSARYDTEGISQLVAAEHKYGETFAGVQMVYAIKGYKMQDKNDNLWKVYNGVVRPYMKKSPRTKGWEWEERDPALLGFARDYINEHGEPKQVTGPQGWQKVNLWEYGSDAIRIWVEYMAAGEWPEQIHGNVDMLDKMVIMPPAFYRDEAAIEEWKREAIFQEALIAEEANAANVMASDGDDRALGLILAKTFSKHRHSCVYPLPCPFIPICHDGMTVESGGYKPRATANHPQEMEN